MIERSRSGDVALWRLAHGKASALDTEFLAALSEALADESRSDARALVITGRGAIFSAGVDLVRLDAGGRAYLEEFLPALSRLLRDLFAFPRPVVAAVNGHAVAGGFVVACACDRRIMARGPYRIGLPELRVGVPFPLAALEVVRFALPAPRAQEAILLGRTEEPDAALAHGFVDELVDGERLVERALAAASELAAVPEVSFRRAKQDLRRPVLETWERHGAASDRELLEAWDSPAVRAAVRDYVAKTLRR